MRSPFLIPSLAALIVSCGDDGMTTPATGTIYIDISGGTGTINSPYAISLDGGSPLTVSLGTVTLSDVPAGSHLIELVTLPVGCGVGGNNPRTVSVSAEQPAHVFFGITCQYPPPGTLQVTVTSSGPAPASYNVLVDGVDQGTVPANGTQTFPNIYGGPRYITLANVPGNCEIQEPNPRLVQVDYGGTAAISFTITCTSPAAS